MLIYSLSFAAAIVAVFVIIVALKSPRFRIARTATMSAPASAVFEQVNDFHNWQAWSPWAKRDPDMKQRYEGAAAGTGATYRWSGNRQVGEGAMTITESRPGERVNIRLKFLKPYAASNTAEFTFTPAGDRTAVTWSMEGNSGFACRAFCMFMNMDKMVGADFEKGLAAMKSIVEARPAERPEAKRQLAAVMGE